MWPASRSRSGAGSEICINITMDKTTKLNPINHGLSVLAMAAASIVAVTPAQHKPNFRFIVSDDTGYAHRHL
jgi:hypothetical protein